jgi:hypothetical protein
LGKKHDLEEESNLTFFYKPPESLDGNTIWERAVFLHFFAWKIMSGVHAIWGCAYLAAFFPSGDGTDGRRVVGVGLQEVEPGVDVLKLFCLDTC